MKHSKLFFACLLMAVLSIGQVWGAATVTPYLNGTAGSNVSITGSNYESGSAGQFSWTATNASQTNTQWRLAENGSIAFTANSGYSISRIEITSTDAYPGTWSATAGTVSSKTISGINASSVTISTNTAARIQNVKVYAVTASTKPTVSLDPDGGNFIESVEVTMTPSTGATVYYTTDATKKTSPSTTTWTAYNGSAKPTFTETTTVWVAAVKDATWSDVVEKTFTKIIPITSYDIDFETTDFDLYVNWDFVNAEVATNGDNTNINAHGGTHYGTTGGKSTAAITTADKIAAPGTLSCYVSRQSTNANSSTWYIQVSENGTEWTNVETKSATSMSAGTWDEFTADLSSYSNVYVRLYYSGSTAVRNVDDISLEMASAVAKPTITVGEEYFVTSTTVTLGCTTDGATIYYTTDGSDPQTSGTKQTYLDPFNATETATIRAIAKKGDDWSAEATSQTVNKLSAITPAAALTIIEGLENKTATTRNYLVAGIICESPAPNVTAGGTATYYISADGSTTSQLQVYKGLFKNGANFTATDQIQAGDDVTIVGKLKKYNANSELDENNEIVTFYPKARLSWSAASYTAALGSSNNFPTLTNTNGVAVTYSSSDDAVATFTDNTDYSTLQLVAAGGPINITASFAGNETYKANAVSYALTVESAVERGTITFNVDGGDAIDPIVDATELPDPLPIPTKAGKNFVAWYTNSGKTDEAVPGATVTEDITLYAVWREPYTVTEALAIIATYGNNAGGAYDVYVAGKVSTASSSNPSSGKLTYSISVDGTASDELKIYLGKGVNDANFTDKTDVQVNDQVVVLGKLYKYYNTSTFVTTPEVNTPNHLYSLTRKAEAGLDWSAASAVVGITGDKNYPTIVNPNSLTGIKYSSSDPTVASFADENTYAITLNAAGTTTITATFEGNEDYKEGSASYTLEVRETLVYGDIDFNCDGANSCPDDIINATNLPNPLPVVTKDGFNFGGWFTNAGKTEAATAGAPLTGDVTLYAKWIEIPTFDNSGYEWQLVTSDAQLVAGKYYVMGRAANSAVASNTLSSGYLSKIAVTYTDGGIAYNGFATAPTTKTAKQAGAAVFQLGGNSTDGWTLTEVLGTETGLLGGAGSSSLAWDGNYTTWPISIDEDGNATIGSTASGENRILYNSGSPRFKTYTSSLSASMLLPQLYVWTEKTFKLRYDANEGTNAPTATPAVAGKAIVTSSVPTAPTGKIFSGWNENAGGTGASYAAGDEVAVSGADVTIFAQWRDPETFTVSYDANGGTLIDGKSDIAPEDVTEGEEYSVKATVYEKTDFVFGGWEYGGNVYQKNDEVVVTEDITFVAKWVSLHETDYVLVTNINQLKDGDKVYIVAAGYDVAMTTQNSGNYRNYIAIGKSLDETHIVAPDGASSPVEFTIGIVGDNFTFNDGEGYLYASSSSSNNLNTQTNLDDNGKWAVTIDGEGNTTIVAQGSNTRNELKWNNSTPRFSCYASGNSQKAVVLYKKLETIRTAGITSGVWGTICPKKEVKYPAGASFFEISYVEYHSNVPYKVFYDEIAEGASLEAGHPYLFQADEESTVIKGIAVGDDATSATNDHGFIGVLENETISVVTADVEKYRYYIVYNNEIRLCGEGQFLIRAERAYLDLTDPTVEKQVKAPIAGRRRVALTNNAPQVATGMDELNASETLVKVMIDGKFYILRGEKMYDATGKLVK